MSNSNNKAIEPRERASYNVHDTVFNLVRQHLSAGSHALDLGAGEGAFSRRLVASGYEVTAVDFSDEFWRAPEIPLRFANFDREFSETVGPDKEKFDAVIAIEIIEHLENPFMFLRECAKLLKKDGLLFLTSPNVESITSRFLFLYTGYLHAFTPDHTLRPAHLTPIFKWKLDLALEEAGFEYVWTGYNRQSFYIGENLHNKVGSVMARLMRPIVKGEKDGENRIVVAKLV
jgi:2-polyprenyl-3-methyl-5-hydroxy-6-metoxy-1,4-benzoquinol methylase